MTTLLPINSIRTDGDTQPRMTTDMFVVDEYASAMRDGAIFPAVTVFFDGAVYWLADGFHRIEAAKRANLHAISADVREGSLSDAQWYSYGVNTTHGLRRTNDDKQRAVKAALLHSNAAGRSNVQIARHCGVAESTVRNYRAEMESSSQIAKIEQRTVNRNGATYTQDTANIGKRRPDPEPEALPFDFDADSDDISDTDDIPVSHIEPPAPVWRTVEVGNHLLICADNASMYARNILDAECETPAALAFADPPYNAGVAEWDDGSFTWLHDFLLEHAAVVAVTPGIGNIPGFMQATEMPYKWSTATFIKNGMTRSALGFGNWLYTAIFSHGSIYKQKQDIQLITINPSDADDLGAKRQKPPQYLRWLFELFTAPGDTIIDAFGGSGTSVLVAEQIGRRCICIESDPNTFDELVARVERALGIAVEKAS